MPFGSEATANGLKVDDRLRAARRAQRERRDRERRRRIGAARKTSSTARR